MSRFDTRSVIHQNSGVRNVTISLEEETARWARVKAAEADKSLSRFVSELLNRERRSKDEALAPPTDGPVDVADQEYVAAMKRYLSRPPFLHLGGDPLPRREELYDRPVLRR